MGEVCPEVGSLCPLLSLCGDLHMDHSKLFREPEVVSCRWLLPHVYCLDRNHQFCHGDHRGSCRVYSPDWGVHHGPRGCGHWDKCSCELLMMRHLVVVYVQGMFPLLDLFSSTHYVAMVFSMCIS